MFTAHRKRKKKKNTHRRSTRLPPPRSRNVACEHGTAQESPRNQPLIQLSPVGMERSLATETSRKGSFLASTMVIRDGKEWSRVTRGYEMETWSTRVRARGTLAVHWCAETTPNDCRVGDAARCLSSNPHHGALPPTTILDSSRGKNGWKSWYGV